MSVLDSYTSEGLQALNNAGVEYLVVGGYAVNFHGYRRTTGDMDIWLRPGNDNRDKLIEAFRSLKVDPKTLKELGQLDFKKPVVFTDGEEPYKLDFRTALPGVKFEKAFSEAMVTTMDDLDVPFISLDNLLLTKQGSKRPQDRMDTEQLQKIQRLKKGSVG